MAYRNGVEMRNFQSNYCFQAHFGICSPVLQPVCHRPIAHHSSRRKIVLAKEGGDGEDGSISEDPPLAAAAAIILPSGNTNASNVALRSQFNVRIGDETERGGGFRDASSAEVQHLLHRRLLGIIETLDHVDRAALYLRRRNAISGQLEFISGCVVPQEEEQWMLGHLTAIYQAVRKGKEDRRCKILKPLREKGWGV